jgi:hypothetical protein
MHAPALAQAVVDVHCTNCDAGWTDYVGAFAGLLGAVLAGVALWLTIRSAADAKASREAAEQSAQAATRTAEASEAQLEVVRNEAKTTQAERARRAAFRIELKANAIGTQTDRPPGLVVLHFGIENSGDRLAEHAVANVVLPPAAGRDRATDEYGNGTGEGKISTTLHDFGSGPERCKYWSVVMRPLSPGTHYVEGHLMLRNPAPGRHLVDVSVDHPDLPGNEARERWELAVPEAGGAVACRRVDAAATSEGEDQ